jgi:protein phosphatase
MSPDNGIPAPHPDDLDHQPADSQFDVAGITHVGREREVNQDQFLIGALHKQLRVYETSIPDLESLIPSERLAYMAMVADGVGGHAAGQEASRAALTAVTDYVHKSMQAYRREAPSDRDFLEVLHAAALQCHEAVLAEAERTPENRGMATTLTLAIGVWPRAYVLQVGDSRCYLLHEGNLLQITRDQTMAQELVDQGVLTSSQAFDSRWAHVLSSAIGGSAAAPQVTRIDHAWDSVLLICSDGLTKHVSDEQIGARLSRMTSARETCQQLVDDALDGGGTDNITVIVGRVRRDD